MRMTISTRQSPLAALREQLREVGMVRRGGGGGGGCKKTVIGGTPHARPAILFVARRRSSSQSGPPVLTLPSGTTIPSPFDRRLLGQAPVAGGRTACGAPPRNMRPCLHYAMPCRAWPRAASVRAYFNLGTASRTVDVQSDDVGTCRRAPPPQPPLNLSARRKRQRGWH